MLNTVTYVLFFEKLCCIISVYFVDMFWASAVAHFIRRYSAVMFAACICIVRLHRQRWRTYPAKNSICFFFSTIFTQNNNRLSIVARQWYYFCPWIQDKTQLFACIRSCKRFISHANLCRRDLDQGCPLVGMT